MTCFSVYTSGFSLKKRLPHKRSFSQYGIFFYMRNLNFHSITWKSSGRQRGRFSLMLFPHDQNTIFFQHSASIFTLIPLAGINNFRELRALYCYILFHTVEVYPDCLILPDLEIRNHPVPGYVVGEVEVPALAGLQLLPHCDEVLHLSEFISSFTASISSHGMHLRQSGQRTRPWQLRFRNRCRGFQAL